MNRTHGRFADFYSEWWANSEQYQVQIIIYNKQRTFAVYEFRLMPKRILTPNSPHLYPTLKDAARSLLPRRVKLRQSYDQAKAQ